MTYLLLENSQVMAFEGPRKPVKKDILTGDEFTYVTDFGKWQESIETAKASRLPVVNITEVAFYHHQDLFLNCGNDIKISDKPIAAKDWMVQKVYKHPYEDKWTTEKPITASRQAYRLVRSEQNSAHGYTEASEVPKVEAVEAKTQELKGYCGDCGVMNSGCDFPECGGMPEPEPTKKETMLEVFQRVLDGMSDEELERQFAELGDIGAKGPTIDEYCSFLQSHYKPVPQTETNESQTDEMWMEVCVDAYAVEIIGVSKVIAKLKEKFILTRRNP